MTGANAHDVTQIEAVLDAIVVKRPAPKQRRSKHLCADAGYRGKGAMAVILAHGYIPHVVSRKSEAAQKKKDPKKKARRWVVEACHGWFNRFRKLLVRYENRSARGLAGAGLSRVIYPRDQADWHSPLVFLDLHDPDAVADPQRAASTT